MLAVPCWAHGAPINGLYTLQRFTLTGPMGGSVTRSRYIIDRANVGRPTLFEDNLSRGGQSIHDHHASLAYLALGTDDIIVAVKYRGCEGWMGTARRVVDDAKGAHVCLSVGATPLLSVREKIFAQNLFWPQYLPAFM